MKSAFTPEMNSTHTSSGSCPVSGDLEQPSSSNSHFPSSGSLMSAGSLLVMSSPSLSSARLWRVLSSRVRKNYLTMRSKVNRGQIMMNRIICVRNNRPLNSHYLVVWHTIFIDTLYFTCTLTRKKSILIYRVSYGVSLIGHVHLLVRPYQIDLLFLGRHLP